MSVHQEEYEVIDDIINGDEAAYKILVDRYKSFAYSIALRILENKEEAEEATMDAFVEAYHSLKNFNREAKFSTWLYRIVFNTSLTYKKNKRLTKVLMIPISAKPLRVMSLMNWMNRTNENSSHWQ